MQSLHINQFSTEHEGKTQRVSARINDIPLWFESSNAKLYPSPEGFGSAVLFAALTHRVDMVIDAPISRRWLENVDQLMVKAHEWWKLKPIKIHCPQLVEDPLSTEGGVGLCFSGGADSFYSLYNYRNKKIDRLIFIHGYDIGLDDKHRIASFKQTLRQVAKAKEAMPVMMKTNLRLHPAHTGVDWQRSHGGALVGAASMIVGLRDLVISASFPHVYNQPWGTHWETDHLWSSGQLTVHHFGAELWRTEKIIAMKDDELVQKHLRVCWENKNSDVNCCCCEKCLRTMLALDQCGVLHKYATFSSMDLTKAIEAVGRVDTYVIPVYETFQLRCTSPDVSAGLAKLISNSKAFAVTQEQQKKRKMN